MCLVQFCVLVLKKKKKKKWKEQSSGRISWSSGRINWSRGRIKRRNGWTKGLNIVIRFHQPSSTLLSLFCYSQPFSSYSVLLSLSLSLSLSHSLKPTVFSFSMFNIFSKSCMCNQWLLMFELLCVAVRLFKRAKSDTIVLTGLSGSGKTVLFYQVSTAFFLFVFLKCVTLWRIW